MNISVIKCMAATAALVMAAAFAQASPIPGSSNEIVNPGFEDSWNSWTHGDGLAIAYRVFPSDHMVKCSSALLNLTLSQIVDETTNPLWDDELHAKVVDLTVDIWSKDFVAGTGITFRIYWWNEDKNSIDDPSLLGAPDGQSADVTYIFSQIQGYESEDWITVNPFNCNRTLFAGFQPRWLKVEIELLQVQFDVVGLDNVILTSQCVPEPATAGLLVLGAAALVARRRRTRR